MAIRRSLVPLAMDLAGRVGMVKGRTFSHATTGNSSPVGEQASERLQNTSNKTERQL